MNIVMYMAISADGYIAGSNNETPWSDEEWQAFNEFQKSCDAILIGRKTYEIMQKHDELLSECNYYVATTQRLSGLPDNVKTIELQSKGNIPEVNKLGVTGGTSLNTYMMKLGVVNELILDVESVLLGEGKRLFSEPIKLSLRLFGQRKIGPTTLQIKYRVTNNKH